MGRCGLRNVSRHCSTASRDLRPWRRIANPARLSHAAVFQTSFDDLVAEQRQHSPAHEQRTRVAVPIDAGSATTIVDCLGRFGGQLSEFFEVQRLVTQKQNRRRTLEQMLVTRTAGHADWQTEYAGIRAVRFVEEPLAA